MGHGALGMGHWAWGMGHWALGIGHGVEGKDLLQPCFPAAFQLKIQE